MQVDLGHSSGFVLFFFIGRSSTKEWLVNTVSVRVVLEVTGRASTQWMEYTQPTVTSHMVPTKIVSCCSFKVLMSLSAALEASVVSEPMRANDL